MFVGAYPLQYNYNSMFYIKCKKNDENDQKPIKKSSSIFNRLQNIFLLTKFFMKQTKRKPHLGFYVFFVRPFPKPLGMG